MCGCNSTSTIPCGCVTAPVVPCQPCAMTMNTDCVIFNKEALSFETTTNNSPRTLTSVLQAISLKNKPLVSEFHTIGDGNFTLSANASVIVLEDIEGTILLSATITLPTNSLDFVGKEFIFINKTPVASGQWAFNVPLVTDYDPFTTQTNFNSIVADPKKVLRLAYLNTTPTSYAWTIIG